LLLLAERRSVLEVAEQAGHSPNMALTTYRHVIEELEGTEKQIPEEVIRRARDELVRTTFAGDHGSRRAPRTNPCTSEALFRTRTGDPLLTMEVSERHTRTRAITRDTVLLQIGLLKALEMRRERSRVSFLMCPFCVRRMLLK
jgi:hypothetical protein